MNDFLFVWYFAVKKGHFQLKLGHLSNFQQVISSLNTLLNILCNMTNMYVCVGGEKGECKKLDTI